MLIDFISACVALFNNIVNALLGVPLFAFFFAVIILCIALGIYVMLKSMARD